MKCRTSSSGCTTHFLLTWILKCTLRKLLTAENTEKFR